MTHDTNTNAAADVNVVAPNTDVGVAETPRVLPALDAPSAKSVRRNAAKRAPRAKRAAAVETPRFAMPTLARVLPANQFALADLARELNIDPKRARGKFRKLRDMKHPALAAIKSRRDNATWIFAKSDRERVAKLLRTPIAALPTK